MKYIAAYLLASIGGNGNPSKEDIERIIESVGIECEKGRAEEIVEKLHGKNLADIINEGKSKLSAVPKKNTAQNPKTPESEENKHESKEEEEENEEMDFGGGFDSLFD